MSQVDRNEEVLSETAAERGDVNNMRLVPVAESIRYRKRAQSAEKEAESLACELAEARSEAVRTGEQLNSILMEQKLMQKLAAAGTIDLEAAVLVARDRMQGITEADLDGVVERLKKEKRYLFGNSTDKITMNAQRTSGAKDRMASGQTVLEKAAKRAATTGSRTDLQEYLKLRRNFV